MRNRKKIGWLVVLGVLISAGLLAEGPRKRVSFHETFDDRHFDARPRMNLPTVLPSAAQTAAEAQLRLEIPDLRVTYDPLTGVARTITNMTGYLSGPVEPLPQVIPADCDLGVVLCSDPLAVGLAFVNAHRDLLGLTAQDVANHAVTDEVLTQPTGVTHFYLSQTHQGLRVYNGQLQVHLSADCRVLSVNNDFVPDLIQAVNATQPTLTAGPAVANAAGSIGIQAALPLKESDPGPGPEQVTSVDHAGISQEPIEARLMLLSFGAGNVRLVWNFQIHTLDSQHVYDFTVDAINGEIITRIDWVAADSYQVYPRPVESPILTTPADARITVVNPADATASPFGWHDTDGIAGAEFTIMRGNNVHAYDDINNDNLPPTVEPDCGAGLNCTFPLDLTMAPSAYTSAAVANLFYWNNVIHDVLFQYGFDSPGGNFQVGTYGAGGAGGDDVRAEAQDGSGFNNANFFTPADGSRPRMQMYLGNLGSCSAVNVDGDLDNLVIVHEYGHGLSNRLVGGPSNVSCLPAVSESPREGISDWYGLVFTHEPGEVGTDPRPVGNYLFCQAPSGGGIRPQVYSTDTGINTYTYESINTLSGVHAEGSVWAQAAWEVYWALVDQWGFNPDIYNATGGSGNQRALLYFTEGMKNTVCTPNFIEMRDGVIAAATAAPYNGEDVCLIWQAFAAFGLGSDATSGATVTNGFSIPGGCESDVYLEDTPHDHTGPPDLGGEPDANMVGEPMWKSRAMWVRNVQDGGTAHQDPEFGQTNYVYAKLFNFGPNAPPASATGDLKLYFGDASTGLTWPTDFTLFATLSNVNIGAGLTKVVNAPWNPPATGHYCLKAIWESAQDPLNMPLGSSIDPNVRNNNNVAWRNVNIVNLQSNQTVEFKVKNAHPQATSIDLAIRVHPAADGERFLDRSELVLDIGQGLLQQWLQTAAAQQGLAGPNPDFQIVQFEGRQQIQLLNPDETVIPELPVRFDEVRTFNMTFIGSCDVRKTFNVDIAQFTGCLEVGGIAYAVNDGDHKPPVIACPENWIFKVGPDGAVKVPPPKVSDNCDPNPVVTNDPPELVVSKELIVREKGERREKPSPAITPLKVAVTYHATDALGNASSLTCAFSTEAVIAPPKIAHPCLRELAGEIATAEIPEGDRTVLLDQVAAIDGYVAVGACDRAVEATGSLSATMEAKDLPAMAQQAQQCSERLGQDCGAKHAAGIHSGAEHHAAPRRGPPRARRHRRAHATR